MIHGLYSIKQASEQTSTLASKQASKQADKRRAKLSKNEISRSGNLLYDQLLIQSIIVMNERRMDDKSDR